MARKKDSVQLNKAAPKPHDIQADKRYIFNETGNIALATKAMTGRDISEQEREVFAEVSVFFAAMTEAMSSTIDPDTKRPYTLYDYAALQNVVAGSGLFVHVAEEDIEHEADSFGATFSKELIERALGLATEVGALSFAQGMIASLGNAGLSIGRSSKRSDSAVANIVFVCEVALGMPILSAMVVSCNLKDNAQTFHIGPCLQKQSVHTKLKLHKDTYLFVTPKFIRQHSSELESVTRDPRYMELIDYLQALVLGTPINRGGSRGLWRSR